MSQEIEKLKKQIKEKDELIHELSGKILVYKADIRTLKEELEWARQAAGQFLHATKFGN